MGVDAVLQENRPILDFQQMAAAQQQDPDILQLQTSSSSLTLKACRILCAMVKSFVICLLGYLIDCSIIIPTTGF